MKASQTNTPRIKRYKEIKARHPRSLVLLCFDGWLETYFEDANTAANALQMKVTIKHQEGQEPIPMLGWPVVATQWLAALRAQVKVYVEGEPEDKVEQDWRYDVITLDPPWRYNNRGTPGTRFGGGAANHYPLMDIAKIAALPIASLAKENAILFCWVTGPLLDVQIECIKSWGFQHKTIGFSWVKTNKNSNTPFFGVGFYTASNLELCLLATRGDAIKPATDTVSQVVLADENVIVAPIGEHSVKPAEVKRRIELMYPDPCRRIELFARERAPGWFSWGNEIESDVQLSADGSRFEPVENRIAPTAAPSIKRKDEGQALFEF